MQYLPPPPAKAYGRGFTLIELSIVLVILALLVGGIVIGQEMIRDSRNRSVVKQIQTLETAILTFRDKYQCLPGDCLKASQFNLNGIVNGVTPINGNGDGRICYQQNLFESALVAAHLHNSGILFWQADISGFGWMGVPVYRCAQYQCITGGNFVNSQNAMGMWRIGHIDLITAQPTNIGGYISASAYSPTVFPISNPGVIPPQDAFAIDSKLDDGLPQSGKVLAYGGSAINHPTYDMGVINASTAAAGATSNTCVTNDTPNLYNVQNDSRSQGSLCVLYKQAGF